MATDSSPQNLPRPRALGSWRVPGYEPLVVLTRGGGPDRPSVESVHFGSVLACEADGRVVYRRGDQSAPVFARSAFKLLYTVGMLRAGAELSDEEIAVACASHSAAEEHLRVVRRLLERHGLDESHLRNTPGVPLGRMERRAFTAAGTRPDAIHHNCSGKHAAMLATCVQRGWDTATYLDEDHPLQRHLLATVEELAGCAVEPQRVTRDGCGALVLPLPLSSLGRAFARLSTAGADAACVGVVRAMSAHPVLAGGRGRDSTRLMEAVPGAVAKDGAEGFFVVVLPGGRVAAVSVADGAMRACVPALLPALAALGVPWQVLESLRPGPVEGWGRAVGSVVTV